MTPEKRKKAIQWLTEECRSLRMAPKINGCGPENWADLLEIMETCLEAVWRFPSAHIDREAWEPCECCGRKTCTTCRRFPWHDEACKKCENQNLWVPNKYCHNCGRPLTKEAWADLEKRLMGASNA